MKSMTPAKTGTVIGVICGLIWVAFGFWSFIFILLLGGLGALIGHYRTLLPLSKLKSWLMRQLQN